MTDENKDYVENILDDEELTGDPKRVDYPRRTHEEEYSAEVAPTRTYESSRTDREANQDDAAADTGTAGRTVGYVGVGLGIASLFVWSIVLGPLAAIMGFYAYSQGSKTSGAWAIGLGAIATLSYFFLIPFTR
ncbi:hypothetical protein [Paenibacillus woosongensis]|uniref:hypothetical protein n=1 Tax=Paenibacillus woosongensis TaxID=307580 RepID=UPI0018C30B0D|nr:hypothetical protein [Paenibacillus woosongensis]